ncbi:MAG: hypothetical protein MI974_30045 [Chitinophagales bacterium]|nr:hypothetical protein [Chitinophagales bacterium]
MPKRRVTPFTRFFIAIIIIVPLAFFAASYINNEDPVSNFKEMVGIEQTTSTQKKVSADSHSKNEFEEQIEELQSSLRERDKEIEQLRQQLKDCQ